MYLYRRHSRQVDIDSRSGRASVFNTAEEEAIARWLCTIATRRMGLKPEELLDFIKGVVDREGRITPFTDGRPGYAWYRSFMARKVCTVGMRREMLLEFSRARLLPKDMDTWYRNYREFLITGNLLDSRTGSGTQTNVASRWAAKPAKSSVRLTASEPFRSRTSVAAAARNGLQLCTARTRRAR